MSQHFKVDDKFAGKTVKCKNCAEHITVPGGAAPEAMERVCAACGATMPAGATICKICRFNEATGKQEAVLLSMPELSAGEATRKRKWIRKTEPQWMSMVDGITKVG